MPFKFLTPWGTTRYGGQEFVYNLPQVGEKWSRPTFAPNMATVPDGQDCGPGGLHLMNQPSACYAPQSWWPWYARPVGLVLGESSEKMRVQGTELRRILPKVWWRMIRLGWLRDANLRGANLCDADLRGANLRDANWNEYTIWPINFTPPSR